MKRLKKIINFLFIFHLLFIYDVFFLSRVWRKVNKCTPNAKIFIAWPWNSSMCVVCSCVFYLKYFKQNKILKSMLKINFLNVHTTLFIQNFKDELKWIVCCTDPAIMCFYETHRTSHVFFLGFIEIHQQIFFVWTPPSGRLYLTIVFLLKIIRITVKVKNRRSKCSD